MARLIDTIPEFEAFAKGAALETPIRREMLWKERYEAAHPEVFEAFYAAAGPPEGRAAMMRELSKVRERVSEAAPVMRNHVNEVDPRLAEVLGRPSEPEPVHVLLVGAFSTNAVVGRLGDDVVVFHCLEWFQSSEGAKVLVAHEGTHAWQELALARAGTGGENAAGAGTGGENAAGAGTGGENAAERPPEDEAERPPEDDLAWLAFSEGFATAASRAVVPDRPEEEYFWYGHPEVEDWLPWCRDRREELIDLFRSSLGDPKAVETFFGAGFVQGKWRVGYFVADELVRGLGRSLPGLAATSVADGKAAVREALGVGSP